MSYHCFSETHPTAQKEHRCIWCFFPILLGSRYVRERSVFDGCHQNFAWHEACRADAVAHFDSGGSDEFVSGNEMPFFALYQLEAHPAGAKEGRS